MIKNLRLLLIAIAVASSLPARASDVDYLREIVPSLGDHTLHILTPTMLELKRINSKPPAPAPVASWDFVNASGQLVAPAPSAFVVTVDGVAVTVTGVGFKRRPFYAPLVVRDLRIDNSIYLQLAAPIADGHAVEVTNPGGQLWSAAEKYIASTDPLRYSPAIHVNQEGYVPGFARKAMVGYYVGSLGELTVSPAAGFKIVTASTGATVFTGLLTARLDVGYLYLPTPYQKVLEADFSAFATPGNYRLVVPGLGASLPFAIDEGIAMSWLRTYALGLYGQRCGAENALPYTRFVHDACHTAAAQIPSPQSDAQFGFTWSTIASKNGDFASNPRHTAPQLNTEASQLYPFVNKGTIDVSGGHHDAGDYSKYTINSATLTHLLMFTADAIPGAAAFDNLGLPESGDGISDILQEAKREADFIAKLQDADGGFYFLVYPKTREYESNTLPAPGDAQVVWPKNTAVTAASVAALAQCASSPRFKAAYPAVAALYLQKATLGWQFLTAAIAAHGKDGSYQKITFYGDNYMHDDELAWAACELYLATGDVQYRQKFFEWLPDPSDPATFRWGWWRMSECWGNAIRSYAFAVRTGRVTADKLDAAYLAKCEAQIVAAGDDALRWSNQNAYASSFPEQTKHVTSAGWYFSLDQASDMAVAYQITPKQAYLDALVGNLNYEGGTNPVNVSYVTGLGQKRQREIVSQYAQNDRRVLPPDGIPLGNIQSSFDYLSNYGSPTYGNELSALVFPSDGAATAPYPIYDRWADSFNLTTEYIGVNQARSLLSVSVLATRTAMQSQAWNSGTAQITVPSGVAPLDLPVTLTVQAPGFDLTTARVTWEARDQEPGVDPTYTLSPKNNGPQWVEAEIQWLDGRHIVATNTFAANSTVVNWVNGAVPAGATQFSSSDAWTWVPVVPATPSGLPAHQSTVASGIHIHWFDNATATMNVGVGDRLFAWVYLDPVNLPSEVMLSWNDGSEEHRAYWGANIITWGVNNSPGRYFAGALPAPGQWVRLTVPASAVALEGSTLKGMGFTVVDSRATWDTAGLLAAPPTPPTITTQPQSQTVTAAANVTFTVVATGTTPRTFQWTKDGTNLAGATSATLTLTNVQAANAGNYAVVVTNIVSSVTSATAVLTVNAAAPSPTFLTQPQSQAIAVGQPVTFTIAVSGTPTPTFQWRKNGTPISGATGTSFTIASVQTTSAANYECVATNTAGTTISNVAVLTVSPATTTPPLSQTVTAGANATLTIVADGTAPLGYQWKRNGRVIAGVTASTYTITNAVPFRDNGWYQSVVTNLAGTTTSPVAFVTIATSPAQIMTWGDNSSGQLNVPAGLTSVIALATGGAHSVALKGDGTVVAWGNNSFGQTTVPGALNAVVGIAAGIHHTLALKADGSVVAWGDNTYGQSTVPAGLGNVVQIVAGNYYSVALKSDGTIVAWGDNSSGQTSVPARLIGVVEIAAGGVHTVALRADATVVAWGYNGSGQTSVPAGLGGVFHLTAGYNHTLALKTDGTVVAWGWNGHGQTTIPAGLNNVAALAAGDSHSLALKTDGTVVAWGDNSAGQTIVPAGLTFGVGLAAGDNHSLAMRNATAGTMPTISTQPVSQVVLTGQPATFTVAATGSPAPTYQWRKGGVTIVGATAASLSFAAVQVADAASYDVVVTNLVSSVTSIAATLTVNFAPSIITQPLPKTVTAGQSTSFTVVATGVPAPTYQWRKNAATIVGATSATLSLTNVQAADAADYSVVVTNLVGSATSSAATLTVNTPPTISTQPQSQTAPAGTTVSFTVVATGTAPLTYQWKKGATAIAGATSATLTLTNVQASDAADYTVVVTNVAGSATSSAGTLTLRPSPTIITQPQSQTLNVGQSTSFSVAAVGTPAPTYRWQRQPSGTTGFVDLANGGSYGGATTATLAVSAVTIGMSGDQFRCVATNGLTPDATSKAVTLTVMANIAPAFTSANSANFTVGQAGSFTVSATGSPAPTFSVSTGALPSWAALNATTGVLSGTPPNATGAPFSFTLAATNAGGSATQNFTLTVNTAPAITTQPLLQAVNAGATVTFSVVATGTTPLAYQWKKGATAITGATSATLTLTNVQATDAASYTVVVTNAAGTVTSSAATLALNVAPAITTQPQSQAVTAGATVSFTVAATGTASLTYQWKKGTVAISSATSATLTLTNVQAIDAADYTVVVTNVAGTATSSVATLAVNTSLAFTTQPAGRALSAGQNVTFSAVVSGLPAPTYQWFKSGVAISGATGASLTLLNLQTADAGSYTVVATNTTGSVTSQAAVLAVVTTLQSVAGPGYTAGGTQTVTNTLTYTGTLTALGWEVLLPTGWSYASGGGTEGDVKPTVGTTSLLDWSWTIVPASPITFTYTLNVPAGATGGQTLSALMLPRHSGVPFQVLVLPDPLPLNPAATTNWVDTNHDFKLSLSELLRTIELYNYRSGTVRTGQYTLQAGTEDGLVPGPGGIALTTVFYSADTNHDGKLSLTELLRVIELYNYRNGTVRTGEYHVQAGTEDGFAPGP